MGRNRVNELRLALSLVFRGLAALEGKISAVYEWEQTDYPRETLGFDDVYLRTLVKECLETNPTDYRRALRHYEAALKVNPFEGDNFVGCALMHLYLEEMDEAFFYVNEGLGAGSKDGWDENIWKPWDGTKKTLKLARE